MQYTISSNIMIKISINKTCQEFHRTGKEDVNCKYNEETKELKKPSNR